MLHSVQHLFLSTVSPSLPWMETKKTQKTGASAHQAATRKQERTPGYVEDVISKGLLLHFSPRLRGYPHNEASQ